MTLRVHPVVGAGAIVAPALAVVLFLVGLPGAGLPSSPAPDPKQDRLAQRRATYRPALDPKVGAPAPGTTLVGPTGKTLRLPRKAIFLVFDVSCYA